MFLKQLKINFLKQFKTYRLCHSFYIIRLMLNTSLFFKASYLKNFIILLFMSCYIKKLFSSLKKYHDLTAKISSYSKIMYSCKECVTYSVIYHIELESSKYTKYLSHTFQKYDLIVSEIKWTHVQRDCLYLYIKIQKTLAHLIYL